MYRSLIGNWKPAAIVFSSFLLFACSGDTGPAGEPGASGSPGPTGPPGTPGPTGSATVPVESAEKINVSFDSVTVPAGGGTPTVVMRLTDDLGFGLTGLPASAVGFTMAQLSAGQGGGSSEWQSYITRGPQASTESASAGTYADNGDGSYTYTFAQALTDYADGPAFGETKTHRLGVEIRTNRYLPENIPANNAPYDFVPTGGAVIEERRIVNNDACNACHDNLELHGEARFDVEYCVTCHNPYSIDPDTAAEPWGGSVDMKVMIHKIHYGVNLTEGYSIVGYGGTAYDYSNIVFTQDVRNCTTCHQESNDAVPQASNWRMVQNRASCGTCHDDIDWAGGNHPGGLAFTDDTQCGGCHNETSGATGLHVPVVHRLPEVEAAKAFAYEVVSVTNTGPGQIPTATIRVSNPLDGSTYDINDPAGPFQIGSSRLNLDISWTSAALGNIDPNDDLMRSADSGAPFAPIQVNFQSGAVNDGAGNFTKAASDAIPTGISGSGLAVLEGRAAVDIEGELDNLPVSSDVLAFSITDASATDRRAIVDIAKCNDCHKNLALHGDNRSGNTEVCSTCHNPHATDIQRRVVDSACEAELGLDDAPIDMKRMVHGIHAGAIGVCGYRNSAHPYFDVVYPGKLNNCEGCHLEGTYYPVDPAVVPATSIDAGADRSSLLDDVAISPNSSVCSSCHLSDLAKQHMLQNGGDFTAGKDELGTIVSPGVETCELCHGEGRSSDVRDVHGIDTFEFN